MAQAGRLHERSEMDTRLPEGRMVLKVFLYAASRRGSTSYHIYHLGSWPGPISQTPSKLDHSHTDSHTESPEMGSITHGP